MSISPQHQYRKPSYDLLSFTLVGSSRSEENRTSECEEPLINESKKLAEKLKAEQIKCRKLKHQITCLQARIKFLESRLYHQEQKEQKEQETALQIDQEEAELLRELDIYLNF